MGISRPVPAAGSAAAGYGPAPAEPARRPDRTQRLIGIAAWVLLVGGLVTVSVTGLNWWSRIHRIETNQVTLARAVDAAWSRPLAQAGAASVPVAQGGAGQNGAGQNGAGQNGAGQNGAAAADPSGAVARLHLPRLHLNLVVVEGSSDADLLRGPGHIPGTPLFGAPGNVGIAGHRYPGAFWDLDQLRDGDPVVVETRETWYVYRVSREMIVGPSDVDVLAPHPAGAPAAARDFLTLVTCDPVFTTLHRLIRQAVLMRSVPRADGPPPELA